MTAKLLNFFFARLIESGKTHKNELDTKLQRKEPISSSDEHWLDNDANTVNEHCVLDTLESALDYERGLEPLDGCEEAEGVGRGLSKSCSGSH